jgi:hypothetical protein
VIDPLHLRFFPSSTASKISRQEDIVITLDPAAIAKKKVVEAEKIKLPQEVQEKINLKIFSYIVGEARPLITVESIHFINLLKEINSRVEVFCVKSLKKLIAKKFSEFKENLKKDFAVASSVCLTADVWGSKNISFLGVTAHWLISDDCGVLKRKSAAMSCKRFPGEH